MQWRSVLMRNVHSLSRFHTPINEPILYPDVNAYHKTQTWEIEVIQKTYRYQVVTHQWDCKARVHVAAYPSGT